MKQSDLGKSLDPTGGPTPETVKSNTDDNAAIIIPYKLTSECDQRQYLQFNTQRVYRLEIANFLREFSHVGIFNLAL
jgi:hypothetical protein